MLQPNEVERQLTQRRLDVESANLRIKQLEAQLVELKNTVSNLSPAAPSGGFLPGSGPTIFSQYVEFATTVFFRAGVILGLIRPRADATNAFRITKADGTTDVVVVDTTNGYAGLGTATPGNVVAGRRYFVIKGISNTGALELIDVTADADNTTAGIIQVVDDASLSADKRLGAIIIRTDGVTANDRGGAFRFVVKTDGASGISDTLQLTKTKMGFFGATPAVQQTLNAYTTDPESSSYSGSTIAATGIQYKDWGGVNQSLTVLTGPVAGTILALNADVNNLRIAYENLRASYDDLRTKLKTTTLVL